MSDGTSPDPKKGKSDFSEQATTAFQKWQRRVATTESHIVSSLGSVKGVLQLMKTLEAPLSSGSQMLVDNLLLKGVVAQRMCAGSLDSVYLPTLKDPWGTLS